jgi:plastocyanin
MPWPLARPAATAATLLACAGITLAGCADDDDDDGGGGGRTVTAQANATVEVVADEYSFDPGNLVVSGAGRLTISLKNQGSLAHNLKVLRGEEDLGGTPTFQGGETKSGVVNLEHGKYRMVCTVGNHEELGMHGTLEVK